MKKSQDGVLKYTRLMDRLGYKKYQNLDKKKIITSHVHEEWSETFKENRSSKILV